MRISDWSSDVCSSDLVGHFLALGDEREILANQARKQRDLVIGKMRLTGMQRPPNWRAVFLVGDEQRSDNAQVLIAAHERVLDHGHGISPAEDKIGRASCRERVCQYV